MQFTRCDICKEEIENYVWIHSEYTNKETKMNLLKQLCVSCYKKMIEYLTVEMKSKKC